MRGWAANRGECHSVSLAEDSLSLRILGLLLLLAAIFDMFISTLSGKWFFLAGGNEFIRSVP